MVKEITKVVKNGEDVFEIRDVMLQESVSMRELERRITRLEAEKVDVERRITEAKALKAEIVEFEKK